ncbi:MBL fold metallo-hydrolase [Cereibacter azotoformans]|uniref:Glyoxylase-like metal-dependent hydrolase (Beta-lactamase superfamily II) n=1 Tax=Cereibacter azotoformans TaxID=43057 RepID=A0A2T5KEV9_9RHOB|nr:MBL fold metallo-hydrolase [Cereibacter azotoformans]AXQ92642.1 MBL fold metallo-hydrolase [Cereibacter sphaeroides]MBO4169776.1 MBL fold metallo-hydrolase [Cereibacter azotoformans]PTR20965.1 glyoxylase-like metal-dependent hydrolase (beta-lactamase superfamily II) [Cereibacter azotoformans]UIJ30919.1 MBL fold metallo-hydrolase [Cereibacter azotoformans]
MTMTRRHALLAGATLPLVPAFAPLAHAAADKLGAATPPFRRYSLGSFEVTPLLAGTRVQEDPKAIFAGNVPQEEFEAAARAAFLPTDRAQGFFTPTLVNTGTELILFDTGLSQEGILAALEAAGHSAGEVDLVVITHMHGDHIGGLMEGETPTFANARYLTGQVENDHWSAQQNEGYEGKVRPLLETMSFVAGGDEAAPGITAVEAFGHTPGHMAWRLESDGQALMLTADAANHYAFSLGHPDWEVRFDMDKAAAAATRRALFGQIAEERIPFIGYHMPFPAVGYVETSGDGFRFVPESYQLMLNG